MIYRKTLLLLIILLSNSVYSSDFLVAYAVFIHKPSQLDTLKTLNFVDSIKTEFSKVQINNSNDYLETVSDALYKDDLYIKGTFGSEIEEKIYKLEVGQITEAIFEGPYCILIRLIEKNIESNSIKLAIYYRMIEPSVETVNQVYVDITCLKNNSKSIKEFKELCQKHGLLVLEFECSNNFMPDIEINGFNKEELENAIKKNKKQTVFFTEGIDCSIIFFVLKI